MLLCFLDRKHSKKSIVVSNWCLRSVLYCIVSYCMYVFLDMGWAPISYVAPLSIRTSMANYSRPAAIWEGKGWILERASIPTSPVRLSIRLLWCHACLVPDCGDICQTAMRCNACICACLPDYASASVCTVATALVSVYCNDEPPPSCHNMLVSNRGLGDRNRKGGKRKWSRSHLWGITNPSALVWP